MSIRVFGLNLGILCLFKYKLLSINMNLNICINTKKFFEILELIEVVIEM